MRFPIVSQIYYRQGTLIVSTIALVFAFIFVIQHMTYTQKSGPSSGSIRDAVDQALESINIRLRGRVSPISSEYNLLDLDETDPRLAELAAEKCTIEWMNADRLQQDHPCVIETIRRRYLHPPADLDVPYNLVAPNKADPSVGQAASILNYLGNQTKGFFIECGALDGEHLSNTLYMERTMQWGGVLVEADQTSFGKLLSRRRKSYALPVCLSLQPYPTQVTFKVTYAIGSVQESLTPEQSKESNMLTLQCFPIYSILLAIGQTRVDFFSLDVEGHELRILKTIPWHKVDIKTLAVEWDHVGEKPLVDYMGPKGYYVFGRNTVNVGNDLFFAKNDSRHR
ncbi:uncharacterized protein LOC124316413 [Daphnia pulicaria]|uniref:uncharacterized protein LOC124316413 n=1 Tax=Daphnia pulicaria TaxID=35523 RepID=UPI001EEAAF31|nr:uncharacterized protein LOC124316413 [Daphnia pulicaria]